MEYSEVILKRRTVRKYDASRRVTKEQAEQVIAAASEAPSWKNSQTGRYYCVISDEMCRRVRGGMPARIQS